jgi:hypothetical protein
MAQTFVDDSGTLVIPQANAKWATAPSNSGIATRGVVVLVGEADIGPDFSQEADGLAGATFGPGQFSAVQAKYGSGPIVDAFRNVANPSRDPQVRGAPTQVITIKTNVGTKAQGALTGGYAVARAKAAGANGNLISVEVQGKTAERAATISKAFIRSTGTEAIGVAANGGTPATLVVTDLTPTAFVATNLAALGLVGVTVAGGVNSKPANGLVAVTAEVTVAGAVVTIAISGGTWSNQPAAGWTLLIGGASPIMGGTGQNSGYYVVTSATPSTIVAKKIVDIDGATYTAPVAVAPGAAADATTCDAYTPVTFTNAVGVVEGLGGSLSIYRPVASTGSHFFDTSAAPLAASVFTTSTTERVVSVLVNRKNDNLSETLNAGGNVALSVGKTGSTGATVTVDATTITLSGGIVLTKASFQTIGDVAAYINAQTGWYASTPAAFQSKSPSVLDRGVFKADQNGIASTGPARIKLDAYAVVTAIGTSNGIEFASNPTTGLPAVQAASFLAGGLKGGTTDAVVAAALAAAGLTRCNFVVTCFSRDASLDIADGLTDSTSTYTIDGINAYNAAHVASFSQFKKRRPRQAFVSKKGTFTEAKTAAQTLASARVALAFQDVAALGAAGTQWFQPWMGAVIAAGMQAAGFYRPIFNKSVGLTGVTQAAGDFKSQDDDQVEEALLAGLLVIRLRDGGGFSFVSDQTTYATDENFVYNSIQAMYVADVIAQTVAQRMERAFVGQSFADVTAGVALSYLKGIMADLKRLKLIATSDDAVDGYKDAKVEIRPPAMLVSAEVKEATGLYFIPISFLVTQVQQTAQQ